MSSKHAPLPTSVERPHEAAPALPLARWLVCPLGFIVLQWTVLVGPQTVLPLVPALWSVPSNVSVEASLPPRPKSMLAAFELGRQVEAYEAAGCGDNLAPQRQLRTRRQSPPNTTGEASPCDRHRARAGAALDAPPLTALQMASAPRMIEDSLSLSARAFGLLNFVNFIWLLAVAGALCTVGPCVVYLFGDVVKRIARGVFEHLVLPLHKAGAFEVAAYVAAFLLTAQAYRYPASLSDAASVVGLTGGLALLPCWAYSTSLFAPVRSGTNRRLALAVGLVVAPAVVRR